MYKNYINNYFLILFSFLPISIIVGSTISLSNILLIDISFIILLLFKKEFSFLKSNAIKYLFIFYIYLIFNSFISIDQNIGLSRNLGFIRIIILFAAFNYFFYQKVFLRNVLYIWTGILIVVLFDIFWERFNGSNIFGWGDISGEYGLRIVSFFKDEPIVGGFVYSFFLIIVGFLFNEFGSNHKKKIIFLSLVFLLGIFLTGERSNTIRSLLGLSIFYFVFKEYDFKRKFIFFVSTIIFFLIVILNSEYLKMRYVDQIQSYFTKNTIYFKLYKSGFEVFKNYKLFGVGNKNYRIETCYNEKSEIEANDDYLCTTHPHQIYFEMLSEHGLFGSILIFFILYKLIFSKILNVISKNNYIQIGTLIYLVSTFLPLLPSGAFFNDYMLTIFSINLSIFFASNKDLNIFNQKI